PAPPTSRRPAPPPPPPRPPAGPPPVPAHPPPAPPHSPRARAQPWPHAELTSCSPVRGLPSRLPCSQDAPVLARTAQQVDVLGAIASRGERACLVTVGNGYRSLVAFQRRRSSEADMSHVK